MTKGAEAFGKEVADFTQKSVEKTVEHGKTVMACKTVNQAVDLQNEIVRSSFDQMVAETTKLTEMSVKTANDAFAPIQDQATQAFAKAFKPVAA
jgi:phasin family protein